MLGIASETRPASGTPDPATYYTRDVDGTLLSERTPTGNLYPITDGQGSIVALVDGLGNVKNTYAYDPYGQTTSATETVPNSFGYVGGYKSPGGLIHFNARYYNPSTARWTQQDPLNQAGDPNQADTYSYAGGDPINNADPSGACIIVSCKTYHKAEHVVSSTVKGAAAGALSGLAYGAATGDPIAGLVGGIGYGAIDGAARGATREVGGKKFGDAASTALNYKSAVTSAQKIGEGY